MITRFPISYLIADYKYSRVIADFSSIPDIPPIPNNVATETENRRASRACRWLQRNDCHTDQGDCCARQIPTSQRDTIDEV